MAVLGFALVGAGIGYALFPVGAFLGLSAAAWGFMAGSVVGQMWVMAHQPTINTQGPRLTDMKLSAGGYGAGIAKTYGSPRVNGNVIWSSDLIETANTQTYGNKKTGKQTVTTYTYAVDCAVGVCEGPIIGFRRIWANGRLIYDVSGAGPVADNSIIPLSGMTFYLGTETQTANAVMQSRLGAANVPAYRGLAYVVFDNLQLEKFGNRHPKFDFEIGTGERLYIGLNYTTDQTMFSRDLVNWETRGNDQTNYPNIYRGENIFCNGFNQFVARTYGNQVEDRFASTQTGYQWTLGPVIDPDLPDWYDALKNHWVYAKGQYLFVGNTNNMDNWTSIDGLNWTKGSSQDPGGGEDHVDIDFYDVIYSYSADVFVQLAYARSTIDTSVYPWVYPVNDFEEMRIYISQTNDRTNFTQIGTIPCTGKSGSYSFNLCEFNNKLWTIYEKGDAFTRHYMVASSSNGTDWTDNYQVPDDDGYNATYIAYILSDGQKLVLLYGGYYDGTMPNAELRTQISTDGINWGSDNLIDSYDLGYLERPFYDGRRFYWSNIYDNPETNRIHFSDDGITWYQTPMENIAPGGMSNIMSISDGDFVQGSDTLAEVIEDICQSAGLEPTDIDTSALNTIDVKGYVRTSQMAARSAIDPLLSVYDVDAYESDGKIKFLPKTLGYSGPTIAETDLGASLNSRTEEAADTVNVQRVQELELPNEIIVRYIDRNLDYDTNQQYARRLTGSSQGKMTVDAPVVFSASEALNLSNSILYRAWVQRDQYSFSTSQKYAAYEPTDMLKIPYGGQNHTVRITKKEENGHLINWMGVSEDLTIYDQNQTGTSGNTPTTPLVPMVCDTDLIIVETPVLRDEADYLGFLAIAGGRSASEWPGGNLFILAENGNAVTLSLGPFANRAITGTLTSNLDPVTDPITADFDLVNTFDVSIQWGTLESHTAGEVLSGMNTCVIKHYDGTAEVLGFQTATLNSPGNYTISKLLRRIRQNSSYSQNGYNGDRFAMLTVDTVKPVVMQLNNLNNVYTFAGPAIGTSLDAADTQDLTLTGMSKKPLSPIGLNATRLLNNDAVISWTRRTRIGGTWATGENGPLGEASEAYEIDVMAANHTTVLRTLTSTTPTVLYTIANQIADFGSQPNTFEVNIYQMSDWVGRGFPANFTFRLLDAGASIQANTCTTGAVS